ncbi:MAG: hypothetical protein QOG71_3877 [Pyrinomonadaceae bacterium]|nr:hypothetical protein [Pyrinomonadaceae bacterium]
MNERILAPSILSVALTTMILLPVVVAAPARAQTPPVSVARNIPFNRTLPTACSEKRIRLTGEFQVQYKVTREGGGQGVIEGDINADKITGSGLTSRGTYKAVGTGRLESSGPSPTSFTYVFNFALNKSGTTDSLMGHVKFRITVNANGSVTTRVVGANIDCTS